MTTTETTSTRRATDYETRAWLAGHLVIDGATEAEHGVQVPSSLMPTMDKAEYEKDRRHDYAGPLSSLMLDETREAFSSRGATHWGMWFESKAGTVLGGIRVV